MQSINYLLLSSSSCIPRLKDSADLHLIVVTNNTVLKLRLQYILQMLNSPTTNW